MSLANLMLDYVVRYGFQVLGAAVILAVGAFLARWVGTLLNNGWTATIWNLRSNFCWFVWQE